MAESDLHLQLKRAATRWLWEAGFAAISDEVPVPGVGIIDVAACGMWRKHNPRRVSFERDHAVDRHHVVFIECKAFRADFLADQGQQEQFSFALAERAERARAKRRTRPRHASPALGKFDTCLVRPHANAHYVLTPPQLLKPNEIPRRWGWLVLEGRHLRVMRKSTWQEVAETKAIEGAIARSLTAKRMRATGLAGAGSPLFLALAE